MLAVIRLPDRKPFLQVLHFGLHIFSDVKRFSYFTVKSQPLYCHRRLRSARRAHVLEPQLAAAFAASAACAEPEELSSSCFALRS